MNMGDWDRIMKDKKEMNILRERERDNEKEWEKKENWKKKRK